MLDFLKHLFNKRNQFQTGYLYMKKLIKIGNKQSINFALSVCEQRDCEYDRGVYQAYSDYYTGKGFMY